MANPSLSKKPPRHGHSPSQRFHGAQPLRGLENVPRSTSHEGRFGRMFRNLPALTPDDEDLLALAATMVETSDEADDPKLDNPEIPAGFTYFGQFIDHDITFDPNSRLQRDNDPDSLRNFRTPRFDLDSLYADGPDNNPYLYEQPDGVKLLVGKNAANEDDLPRNTANPRRALTGDPRNDENAIVSQLHLAFIKFHNKVVDALSAATPNLFDEARRIVRWHYQWLVIHDFLRRIVGEDVINDIIRLDNYKVPFGRGTRIIPGALNVDLKFYAYKQQPFIPVEFSVAAYRFGHSMVRGDYELNPTAQNVPIFDITKPDRDLSGFKERRPGLEIQWARFFEFPGASVELQNSRKLDTKLSPGLKRLPFVTDMFKSLAERNLLRGKALGLPSGQAVARAMGLTKGNVILKPDELELPTNAPSPKGRRNLAAAFGDSTPLWYYILKEAAVRCESKQLGPVGGRIVAEVLIGLLDGDPSSFLSAEPTWQPKRGQFGAPQNGKFSMSDLLRFAGAKIA